MLFYSSNVLHCIGIYYQPILYIYTAILTAQDLFDLDMDKKKSTLRWTD